MSFGLVPDFKPRFIRAKWSDFVGKFNLVQRLTWRQTNSRKADYENMTFPKSLIQSTPSPDSHERENVRAQFRDDDPGHDQEPRVVDHEGAVLLAPSRRPSDEAVAGCELSRRGAVAEQGDGPAVAVVFGAAHPSADQRLVVEATRRYIDRGFTFSAADIDLLLLAKGAQSLRASFGEPA